MLFRFDQIGGMGLGCISTSESLSNHVPCPGGSSAEHTHMHTLWKKKEEFDISATWFLGHAVYQTENLLQDFKKKLLERFYFIAAKILQKDNSA